MHADQDRFDKHQSRGWAAVQHRRGVLICLGDPIAGRLLGAAEDAVVHRATEKHAGAIGAVVDEN